MGVVVFVVEEMACEFVFARVAGVFVPDAAGDDINPTIAIDIDCSQPHIGARFAAYDVFFPVIGVDKAEPVDDRHIAAAFSAEDEIGMPVFIEIGDGGLSVIAEVIFSEREIGIDDVMFEGWRLRESGIKREED